jgi:hypothetical protein
VKGLYGAPVMATARNANVLVAAEPGLSPATLVSYAEEADGTLTQKASTRDAGSNLGDLAVTPDGSTVYTACGAPYEILAFSVADLSPRGRLTTDPYPDSVAVSPQGTRLAGGSDAYYDPDVFVFSTHDPIPKPGIELGAGLELKPRGLAWGTGGVRLYAVTGGSAGLQLHILTP